MRLKLWWNAARPNTLFLSVGPVLLGNGLAAQDHFSVTMLALSITTALLLQLLTNIANDYGDTKNGVDTHRPGARRHIQSGKISLENAYRILCLLATLSLLSGTLLILLSNLSWLAKFLFFVLGGISITAAIFYSLGSKPYGHYGFGDLSVFLFFGLAAVTGAYYLQFQQLPFWLWLPGTAIGLLSVGVLNINNIRDLPLDRAAGKKTLALYLGKSTALAYFSLSWVTAMILAACFALVKPNYWVLTCLLLTPVFLNLDRQLRKTHEFTKHNQLLARMVKLTFIYEMLFLIGIFLS